jgi:ubiquinone/menaquinone biosynthesis C-methylase UbiE
MSFALPYPDGYFDRVLSSLLFHHLTLENKSRTLSEVFRVLKHGGEFHLADWGKPQNVVMRTGFLLVQAIDGFKTTADNARGLLPELIRQAGFQAVEETGRYQTTTGTLSLHKAQKPV